MCSFMTIHKTKCDCLFPDGKCYLGSQTASHISVVSASVTNAIPPVYIRITPIHRSPNVNPLFHKVKKGENAIFLVRSVHYITLVHGLGD